MELLTGKDINEALFKIIEEADETLVIVSPYIILDNLKGEWEKIVEKLKEKSKARIVELHTRPYFDKNVDKETNTIEKLSEIFTGISPECIYFNKNLHAKLYFNGKKALITSLNLLERSIEKSIEIGYLTDDIDECKKIKEQFIEKYLIEPYKEIRKNIEYVKKEILIDKYDTLKYDYNKITIENKKHSNTAFVLECYYGMFMKNNHYLLEFKITAHDENVYSQIQQDFMEKFKEYNCRINGYDKDESNKTFTFRSDIIFAHEMYSKPDDVVFYNNDIRNVFCNETLSKIFITYIGHTMITLRNILYH